LYIRSFGRGEWHGLSLLHLCDYEKVRKSELTRDITRLLWEDNMGFRIEHDTMGEIKVSDEHFWGAQTQHSLENFFIGTETIPSVSAQKWESRMQRTEG
ncbi:MAG: hypothetical protein J5965_24410, partial [Aeriscardovia sp.]|nr:hypothetical protein [Aeriscardovia sp.]